MARHGKAWQGMARHLLRSPLEVTKHHARKNNDEEKVEMIEEKQRRLRANFALLSSLALKGKAGM
jgi:transposase